MTLRPPLLLAVAALVLATSCTPGAGGGGGGDGKSFEFWSFAAINQKLSVDAYRAKRPDVEVKLTEVGTSVETAQALTTALAGGKVPDLVLIQGDNLPQFVQQPQNFVDLRTLGADDMAGDYLDWVWKQSVAKDGEVLGVPTDVGGMAVAYRTDLFAAAGLPTDPEAVSALWPTWDAFIETGKRYKQATGKAFTDNAATSVFYQAVNQVSEKYYSEDRKLVYETNPQVKAAFELGIKAATAGITAGQSSFESAWSAGMAQGQYAAVSAPSWMLNTIRSTAPDTNGKWNIAKIPGGSGNWGGSYLAIPKRAKNPQAAWDYIKEMQSPQGQLEHFTRVGALPSTPSVYQDPKLADAKDPFFSDAPTGKIYTDAVLGLKPFYIGPDSATIGQEFLNAITNVEQSGGDPATAWDDAVRNIKTAIGG
ncbi:extracellular solute-binding protein [Saccharothrix coeruleofusca]|uniref:ABC transporter substrate-binding protein n=1 Tax=Saccharothrix coeruleofusca TaxID=33919 RepID=A0A918AV91_9PSEU|nr:extracellular solute-binding protein [Saccharothrix coeruleofusca]MBP2335529.1 cellobiose transport system substrate-binding protein [Saccharothrix coeruleofusca]GGP79947.1 ABC transporter substrate-binding protein [Saccharothrix coeruleofusca]